MKTEEIYQLVTDKVIEKLEQGICPWHKPWNETGVMATNAITGKEYSLLNQLLLGYSGQYLTFKQAKSLGGNVRKGSVSIPVVFWTNGYLKKIENEDGTVSTVHVMYEVPILKRYNVFSIADIDGVVFPAPKIATYIPSSLEIVDAAERVIEDYSEREHLTIDKSARDGACYSLSSDKVMLPRLDQFGVIEEYYSTCFHELIHSTGHPSRLKRDMSGRFGTTSYAREELVAEMGAAFSLSRLGLDSQKAFDNSVAYIQSWKKRLTEDSRAVVLAAGRAEKAVEMIFGDKS